MYRANGRTTGCSGRHRPPLNRSVNATELRIALWLCDLCTELPHLAMVVFDPKQKDTTDRYQKGGGLRRSV